LLAINLVHAPEAKALTDSSAAVNLELVNELITSYNIITNPTILPTATFITEAIIFIVVANKSVVFIVLFKPMKK